MAKLNLLRTQPSGHSRKKHGACHTTLTNLGHRLKRPTPPSPACVSFGTNDFFSSQSSMGPASRAMVAERRPRPMIGTVMPPKSPELAASVSEMELKVEKTTWLSH